MFFKKVGAEFSQTLDFFKKNSRGFLSEKALLFTENIKKALTFYLFPSKTTYFTPSRIAYLRPALQAMTFTQFSPSKNANFFDKIAP
jgi:hypothetical protein